MIDISSFPKNLDVLYKTLENLSHLEIVWSGSVR